MKVESVEELCAELERCIDECDRLTNETAPELFRNSKRALRYFKFSESDEYRRGIDQINTRVDLLRLRIKEINKTLGLLRQKAPQS